MNIAVSYERLVQDYPSNKCIQHIKVSALCIDEIHSYQFIMLKTGKRNKSALFTIAGYYFVWIFFPAALPWDSCQFQRHYVSWNVDFKYSFKSFRHRSCSLEPWIKPMSEWIKEECDSSQFMGLLYLLCSFLTQFEKLINNKEIDETKRRGIIHLYFTIPQFSYCLLTGQNSHCTAVVNLTNYLKTGVLKKQDCFPKIGRGNGSFKWRANRILWFSEQVHN